MTPGRAVVNVAKRGSYLSWAVAMAALAAKLVRGGEQFGSRAVVIGIGRSDYYGRGLKCVGGAADVGMRPEGLDSFGYEFRRAEVAALQRDGAAPLGVVGEAQPHCARRVRVMARGWHVLRIAGGILRVMQTPAPPLLPLLRSRLQAELLTLVLLTPGREWSLTELADRTGASVSSAQREMARAEDAGVVSSRRLGSARLVSAADSPLTGPLTDLLLRSFGPRQVVAEELAGLAYVEAAYLFGSWAARYAGQPGPAPADIDVLVIGHPDRDDLDEAAQRAGSRLAREVNVTVRSAQWWHEGGDGFHAEVIRRPLVPVFADASRS